MKRNEFLEKFEELVGKVQGVEMTPTELMETMESTFKLNSAYSDDFILDTIFKMFALVDKDGDDEFTMDFDTMIITVTCINVGDKVKPVLITYASI